MSGGCTNTNEGTNLQWSKEQTKLIIDMYRQKPCLWNIKSSDYKDRTKRTVALTAITREMQKKHASVTIADVKKKLETLRNQHRREMRQIENSRKSGAGTDDVYSPKLWCFDNLSFLIDGGTMRASQSNIDLGNNEEDVEERHDHEIFNDPLLVGEAATSVVPRESAMSQPACSTATHLTKRDTSTPSTSKRSAKRTHDDADDVIREALHQMRELSSTQDTADECTDFAKVIANDLRQVTGETRILAQKLIYDVLFLAKVGKLSSSTMVKE